MCTGKCSRFIAVALYPLVVISIICNIVLFFPDGNVTYDKDGHITEEVKYMGGLIGGGVLVSGPLFFSVLLKDRADFFYENLESQKKIHTYIYSLKLCAYLN